jgi:hypothetical protein
MASSISKKEKKNFIVLTIGHVDKKNFSFLEIEDAIRFADVENPYGNEI